MAMSGYSDYDPDCPQCNPFCGCGWCGECNGSALPSCDIHGYKPPPANPLLNVSTKIGEEVTTPKHPIQPVVFDDHGVIRFKENAIVRFLLDFADTHGTNMNTLAIMPFSQEDREQFAQLIGYSVSGFGDLSYASDEVYYTAAEAAQLLRKT